jgi:hypothetical protein
VSHKQLTDEELDALVVRSLSRLPAFAPSRAFEARVMARVRLPAPRPVARYRRARAWVAQPRRAMALAGAYSVAALAALGVAVPWVIAHSPAIAFGLDWIAARALGLVHSGSTAFAGWALSSGIAQRVRSLPLSAPQVWGSAALITAGYTGCAALLRVLLRAPGGHDAPVQLAA